MAICDNHSIILATGALKPDINVLLNPIEDIYSLWDSLWASFKSIFNVILILNVAIKDFPGIYGKENICIWSCYWINLLIIVIDDAYAGKT